MHFHTYFNEVSLLLVIKLKGNEERLSKDVIHCENLQYY